MHTVDLYLRVRLACHVDGLSQREAASRFGIARETVKKMLRPAKCSQSNFERHHAALRSGLCSFSRTVCTAGRFIMRSLNAV